MEYQPPDPADLANVHSLNLAFLELARNALRSPRASATVPPEIARKLRLLGPKGLGRLARCPFLIFSLAEQDVMRWSEMFDNPPEADLFTGLDKPNSEETCLVSAAVGFLWQQANRCPYAARVVSGATLEWCERLAECTLLELLQRALNEGGLLQIRFKDNAAFWEKLIVAGTSDEQAVRAAARITGLQTILTAGNVDRYRRLPAAACRMPEISQQVAQQRSVSKARVRGYNTPPDESAVDKRPHQNIRKR